jgi:lysozyme family protein
VFEMTFDDLAPEYTRRLAAMKLTEEAQAKAVAERLLKQKGRFLLLQLKCGVPPLWVMPVFEREEPSFTAYLGNGDPLDKPTTHVPEGRGPFETWETGAADALTLDRVTLCPSWTWEYACYEWEKWNGFGPRNHGRPSGYLWSGTDQYAGGKYVADGVWSRGTWDHQLGCVLIAKEIAAMDEELAKGFGA